MDMGRITFATLLALASLASMAQVQWQARVSTDLLNVYTQRQSAGGATGKIQSAPTARFDARGRVQVDVHFDCSADAPTSELTAAGLSINTSVKIPPFCVVEGWVAPGSLPAIASVDHVLKVELPHYAVRKPSPAAPGARSKQSPPITQGGNGNTIDGEAITIMHADEFLSTTGVSGQGVTIGVMSGNVTSLAVIQGRGELPSVTVVPSSPGGQLNPNSNDEGTMMLEEVHAVAPRASLAFCGPETSVDYPGCIQQLIAVGATVLVDDIAFYGYDMMSANDDLESAVQSVLSQNPTVMLFTAADNMNGSYWEGGYAPVSLASLGASSLICGSQTDNYVEGFAGAGLQNLTDSVSGTYPILFEWADPFNANASNFDLYLFNTSNNSWVCTNGASSSTALLEALAVAQTGTYDLVIGTPDQTLAGKFLKLLIPGDGATALSAPTSGGIFSPQTFVPGVVTTGATNASDGIGDTIEPYSGTGPINLIFPSPVALQAPYMVSLDAIYVDASGTTFTPSSDGLFHGTSAAAPNAAAVAALIRSAFPGLSPTQVTTALETGAAQLGATVPDGTYGYGRVDAMGALGTVPGPTISSFSGATILGGSSSAPASFTVSGTGTLKLSVQSSTPALVPASLVSAGTAGVTVAPTSCGAPTTACTVSVTPVLGQVGNAMITLIVTDGANRQASSSSQMQVTKPAAPTVSITGGGSQAITQGATPTPISFSVAGTGSLTVTASSSNAAVLSASGISLTSGCGSSTKTCTATLSASSGQAGTSTITLEAMDAYGQSGTANASLQISDPPSHGGGGSIDPEALLLLAGILAWRVSSFRAYTRRTAPRLS
jgi:hypothetical protein